MTPQVKMQTAFQYVAYVRRRKDHVHIEFPDAPGCEATVRAADGVYSKAKATIENWLRTQLESGARPNWPGMHRSPAHDQERVHVTIEASLALALQVRVNRHHKGWSQTDLAKLVGVSQQQIAKLEDPDGNPTLDTITKVASVFDGPLVVVFGNGKGDA